MPVDSPTQHPVETREWSAARVRELRLRLDLTQEEFAELIGVHSQTVSSWERNRFGPQNLASLQLDHVLASRPEIVLTKN